MTDNKTLRHRLDALLTFPTQSQRWAMSAGVRISKEEYNGVKKSDVEDLLRAMVAEFPKKLTYPPFSTYPAYRTKEIDAWLARWRLE